MDNTDTKQLVALTPAQVSALWLLVGDKLTSLLEASKDMVTDEATATLEETTQFYRDMLKDLGTRTDR